MKYTLIKKTQNSTEYIDKEFIPNSYNDIINHLCEIIQINQSVILERQNLKNALFKLYPDTWECEFKNLKFIIRSNYDVHKLKFNPRTFEFLPRNKCFVIHKK